MENRKFFTVTAPQVAAKYLPEAFDLYWGVEKIASLSLTSINPVSDVSPDEIVPITVDYAAVYEGNEPLPESMEERVTKNVMLLSLEAVCDDGNKYAKDTDLVTTPRSLARLGANCSTYAVQYKTVIRADPHNSYIGFEIKNGHHSDLLGCWEANLIWYVQIAKTLKVAYEKAAKKLS